eukprot:g13349.t2
MVHRTKGAMPSTEVHHESFRKCTSPHQNPRKQIDRSVRFAHKISTHTESRYTTKILDRMVHLNNDAVQKQGEEYGKFETGNKLSLEEFQKFLDEHASRKVHVREELMPKCHALMADAIRSAAEKLNDGGNVDFGPLCQEKEYNCIFERVKGENSRWNPHSWFARFRKATQALGTEYVIYLEPDVLIRKHHSIEPKHDAGGIYDDFNPHMGKAPRSEKSWAAFEHNHKEHYNDPVPTKDRQLIRTFAETFPDTTCHGCVWYHDADPKQVFGFDFMVDAEFRVWLIECNANPCLDLLDQALRLTVDSFTGENGQPDDTKWELLYDSLQASPSISSSWLETLPAGFTLPMLGREILGRKGKKGRVRSEPKTSASLDSELEAKDC